MLNNKFRVFGNKPPKFGHDREWRVAVRICDADTDNDAKLWLDAQGKYPRSAGYINLKDYTIIYAAPDKEYDIYFYEYDPFGHTVNDLICTWKHFCAANAHKFSRTVVGGKNNIMTAEGAQTVAKVRSYTEGKVGKYDGEIAVSSDGRLYVWNGDDWVSVGGGGGGSDGNFAPLLGEGWGEKGQFAFGPGSKAQYTKDAPAVAEEEVEPILFSATATVEGETDEFEEIPCLIVDPSQGASAFIAYEGQTYEVPDAPEGALSPYVVAYIFPKSDEYPEQVAPKVGMRWYYKTFEVFSVVEVPTGWIAMSYISGPVEGLPAVYPIEEVPGFILVEDFESFGVSYALGYNSIANGNDSIASGNGSKAMGNNSVASGNGSKANGEGSVASGLGSEANGECSVASGYYAVANAAYSIASGDGSEANGRCSVASGLNSTADGDNSIASGNNSDATGDQSIASGDGSKANGDWSIASGRNSEANGDYSIASGNGSKANGEGSVASGYFTTASGDYSTVIGSFNVDDSSKIFIIGNGTNFNGPKSIFTIDYNGKPDSAQIPSVNGGDIVVVGTTQPTAKPRFTGQMYLNSTSQKLYVAKGTTAVSDWVAIN